VGRRARYFSICALMLFAQPASAGTASAGLITHTISFPAGQFIFSQNGARTSAPSCAFQGRWAVDVSTAGGQAAQANVLTAFAMGKPVYVTGTGTCSVDSASETVLYIVVGP